MNAVSLLSSCLVANVSFPRGRPGHGGERGQRKHRPSRSGPAARPWRYNHQRGFPRVAARGLCALYERTFHLNVCVYVDPALLTDDKTEAPQGAAVTSSTSPSLWSQCPRHRCCAGPCCPTSFPEAKPRTGRRLWCVVCQLPAASILSRWPIAGYGRDVMNEEGTRVVGLMLGPCNPSEVFALIHAHSIF